MYYILNITQDTFKKAINKEETMAVLENMKQEGYSLDDVEVIHITSDTTITNGQTFFSNGFKDLINRL